MMRVQLHGILVWLFLNAGVAFGAECNSGCKAKAFQESSTLDSLANVAKKAQDFAEAESLYRRSLAIDEGSFGIDHQNVAADLHNLAFVFHTTGRYAEAEPLYRRALAIDEKALGPDHPAVANSLNNLAFLFQTTGRYADAEHLFRRALAINETALGPNHLDVATSLNNLGEMLRATGRYGDAEPLHRRALAINEQALGPDHPAVATSSNSLALLLKTTSRYGDAEPLYRRALAIREKALGLDHPDVATSLNNLALLLDATSRYGDAEPLYRRALVIDEKALGPDHPAVANSLHNLASLLLATSRYGDAEPLYRRALAIREKALGPDHPDVANSLNNLAALLDATGRYGEAEPLFRRALAIHEKAFGPDHPDVATGLNNLAGLLYTTGRYADAEPLCRRALRIAEHASAPDVLWPIQSSLRSFFKGTHPDLAILYGKQAVNTIQSLRANFKNDKETGKSYLESLRSVYTDLSDLLVSQGRIPEAQQVLALLKDQEASEFTHRSLAESPLEGRVSMIPLEAAWNDSMQQVGGRLAVLGTELRALREKGKHDTLTHSESVRADSLESLVQKADSAYATVVEHLMLAFSQISDQERSQQVEKLDARIGSSLKKTISDLDSGTVLLQYVLLDSTGQILLTTGNVRLARSLKAGTKQINPLVNDFVQALRDPHRDPRPLGRKLYDLLIAPVAADLDSAHAKMVMLSLDGTLRYIPMAALFDGNRYLVECYALSLYSTYSVGTIKDRPLNSWSVAGLGNSQALGGFDSLPAVRAELHSIVRERVGDNGILPGLLRLDTSFTKAGFLSALRQHKPVVHLASHFKFSPSGDYDSYLLLGDGTKLNLHDLGSGSYDLSDVDLLTLSACQTAIGTGVKANGVEVEEGMAGVALKRGAKAVMATLWPVVDASTQSFMQEFYRDHEAGLTKAAALRKAQLAFLKNGGSAKPGPDGLFIPPKGAPYAHPYYWAPFILMGNWL